MSAVLGKPPAMPSGHVSETYHKNSVLGKTKSAVITGAVEQAQSITHVHALLSPLLRNKERVMMKKTRCSISSPSFG